MVGIRSPDGLVVGSCTSHPGVLGSIPKREEPGKTGQSVQDSWMGLVTRRAVGMWVLVMNHLTILREMSSWGLSSIYGKLWTVTLDFGVRFRV
jgi:hypothetical protein